jgi:hypothetical protein
VRINYTLDPATQGLVAEIEVGDATVRHGAESVLVTIDGRYPGSTQLTPDQADQLANVLHTQAQYARSAAATD